MGNGAIKQILVLGLENAGKTTLLRYLNDEDTAVTMPTIGFQQKKILVVNKNVTMMEIGGSIQLRTTWKNYYKSVVGVIFLVDSTDHRRLSEAQAELDLLMQDLADTPILVMANKCDLQNALSEVEIASRLALHSIRSDYSIRQVSCVNGTGIDDAVRWIVEKAFKTTLPIIAGKKKVQ